MRKTFFILLTALCISCIAAGPLPAGQEPDVAAIQAAWAQEPPLEQSDIDNYLGLWPQMMDMAQQGFAKEDFRKIFKQANWSDIHGSYVMAKMNMALILLEAPELEAKFALSMPEGSLPSDAEMELVRKNHSRILKVQNAYIERQLQKF